MVEAAGVEPTVVHTATRVCSSLLNVYRMHIFSTDHTPPAKNQV